MAEGFLFLMMISVKLVFEIIEGLKGLILFAIIAAKLCDMMLNWAAGEKEKGEEEVVAAVFLRVESSRSQRHHYHHYHQTRLWYIRLSTL